MGTIEIDVLYFDAEDLYTKDLINEIEEMYENGLVYYTVANTCIIFSSSKLSKEEGMLLEKIIDDKKGYDTLISDGIKTEVAEYRLVQK